MSTMNNVTKWNDSIIVDKASGTKVTIGTDGKYVEKDIELTINVQSGHAATPNTSITANPSLTIDSSTGVVTATVSATKSVTPTISPGFVSSGTSGTISASGSKTLQLSTKAAQTIVPGTTNKTIASGIYLTGQQTIAGDSNLLAKNIKTGKSIFNVEGTFTDSSTVSSGQTAATASKIMSGYSAWVDGVEVMGTMTLDVATVEETMNYLSINAVQRATGVSF